MVKDTHLTILFSFQSLIVGDATMQVPISWSLGEVNLKFSGKPVATKRQERLTKPQPVIDVRTFSLTLAYCFLVI